MTPTTHGTLPATIPDIVLMIEDSQAVAGLIHTNDPRVHSYMLRALDHVALHDRDRNAYVLPIPSCGEVVWYEPLAGTKPTPAKGVDSFAKRFPRSRWTQRKAAQLTVELGKFLDRFTRLKGRAYYRDMPEKWSTTLAAAKIATAEIYRCAGVDAARTTVRKTKEENLEAH